MGIIVHSILWGMQDLYHQPQCKDRMWGLRRGAQDVCALWLWATWGFYGCFFAGGCWVQGLDLGFGACVSQCVGRLGFRTDGLGYIWDLGCWTQVPPVPQFWQDSFLDAGLQLQVYPQAPQQFLFGITLQESKYESPKGTMLGIYQFKAEALQASRY